MPLSRRTFNREFKIAAVKRLEAGTPAGRLARELEVNPNQLHSWRREYRHKPNSAFSGEGRRRQEETQVAELERKIGQQAMELDFLKGCLRRIEDLQRAQAAATSAPRSTNRSGKNKKGAAR